MNLATEAATATVDPDPVTLVIVVMLLILAQRLIATLVHSNKNIIYGFNTS
jgi:hypothetical protein